MSFLAGVVCLAFLRRRRLGLAVLAVAILLVALLYPLFVEWRLALTYGTSSADAYLQLDISDQSRLNAMLAGLDLFGSSPVFGIGFGHYQFLSQTLVGGQYATFPHNWYMEVLAELGVAGAVLMAIAGSSLLLGLRRTGSGLRVVGLSVFFAYAAGSLFTEPMSSFQTSAFALVIVVSIIVARPPGLPTQEHPR